MITIVGGGIIGLSIGWTLARNGEDVTLCEEDVCGRDASWASAGMLAAHIGTHPGVTDMGLSVLALQREGVSMWAGFARELEASSGVDVCYRNPGSLRLAFTPDEQRILEADYELQRSLGLEMRTLSPEETLAMEPAVSKAITGSLFSTPDGQIEPRKVMEALRTAFLGSGGTLREHCRVKSVDVKEGEVAGIETAEGVERADAVILAAGAWSSLVWGIPKSALPTIEPAKGQMLALRMKPGQPLLGRVVSAKGGYNIPRTNGRLVIGATMESAGFDTANTVDGIVNLLSRARDAIPSIATLPIAEMWAGLRPKSLDSVPVVGPTSVKGLVMATGHFHIGIVLSPVTAKYVCELVTKGTVAEAIRPFSIERFKN